MVFWNVKMMNLEAPFDIIVRKVAASSVMVALNEANFKGDSYLSISASLFHANGVEEHGNHHSASADEGRAARS